MENKKADIEQLLRLLYDNFKTYFNDGNIIVSGSVLYEKLGLIKEKSSWTDLDISINTGEYGDKILDEMITFFEKSRRYRMTIQEEEPRRGTVKTPFGLLDIFREDFTPYTPIDLEILPDVHLTYHGEERILEILVDCYYLFLYDSNINQCVKMGNTIREIYPNIKTDIQDKELVKKLKTIL